MGRKAIEVALTEINGKLTTVDVRMDQQGRHTEQIAGTITDLLGRLEERVTLNEVRAHDELVKHEQSVNPHPNQEQWLGRRFASQGEEIDGIKEELSGLRTELATFRSQWKTWGVVATALLGVGSPLLVHYLGG